MRCTNVVLPEPAIPKTIKHVGFFALLQVDGFSSIDSILFVQIKSQ